MIITHHPLHRSGRAGLPHPALASGNNAHASERIGVAYTGWRQVAWYGARGSGKADGWNCETGQILQKELSPLVRQAVAEDREVEEDVELDLRVYLSDLRLYL